MGASVCFCCFVGKNCRVNKNTLERFSPQRMNVMMQARQTGQKHRRERSKEYFYIFYFLWTRDSLQATNQLNFIIILNININTMHPDPEASRMIQQSRTIHPKFNIKMPYIDSSRYKGTTL